MVLNIEDNEEFFDRLINTLKNGGVIALPTDTSYGLVADGTNPDAIARLNSLKKQNNKPYTLFISKNYLPEYAVLVKEKIINYFIPGPMTVILKKKPGVNLPGQDIKIGIRIPDADFIKKLLNIYKKPLAVTSATINNKPPFTSACKLMESFPEVELVVDGGSLFNSPTTVLDLTTTPPTILRKGRISVMEIEKIYGRTIIFHSSLKFNVLFVCTGNICRSPIARGILKMMVPEDYLVINTAGIAAVDGLPASPNAQKIVQEFGGSILDHRSRYLTKELIEEADLILVMEYRHYEAVIELSPQVVAKTFLLKEYKRRTKYNEVSDPVGKELSAYRDTALEMYPSLKLVARDIKKRFLKFR